MKDRKRLLREIQKYGFAMLETSLYLDTHKGDAQALAFHKDMADKVYTLRQEYTQKYEPLSIADNTSDSVWEWVTQKWPWEYESEV